ncbi:hypothetical protein ACFWY6_21195 [Streptomyces sp. NPDC059037]|uniref:hypothetical protein n=1 Tax=Streptomyces sp. NPDC059037 TaxID=3346710 RepID=UPI00369ACC1B
MSSLRANDQASILGEPTVWIDSAESTTHKETVNLDGTLIVSLLPEADHAATVTVTITDYSGQEVTCAVTSKSNDPIPVRSGAKVRVTYTATAESHAKVTWTPMGAS